MMGKRLGGHSAPRLLWVPTAVVRRDGRYAHEGPGLDTVVTEVAVPQAKMAGNGRKWQVFERIRAEPRAIGKGFLTLPIPMVHVQW